jgi:glycosyltransferase involved in cell wall biosynthesis
MIRVLAIADYFAPGFRGGGTRHLTHIVDRLHQRIEFSVITRDRDVGMREAYEQVPRDRWIQTSTARLCYLSPGAISLRTLARRVREAAPDVVLLNSVFSTLAIRVLLLRRLGALRGVPVVLACEGELADGALLQKPVKKRAFLAAAAATNLYRDMTWKASSAEELDDIHRVIGPDARVVVAPIVIPSRMVPEVMPEPMPKTRGQVRLLHLSRITPKKNLRFLLDLLARGVDAEVNLDIVGPIDDAGYWDACQAIIRRMPSHVRVRYGGESSLERIDTWYGWSHALVLPTLGENFGFVLLEALAAARPVLVSQCTPWRDLTAARAGWDLPLDRPRDWREAIEQLSRMDAAEYASWSAGAWSLARAFAAADTSDSQLATLLETAARAR